MTDSLLEFVRARLNEDLKNARFIGNTLVTQRERLGVSLQTAEKQARARVRAAEVMVTLFEETVVPYLGTAGPGGRNAERQLHLLAETHTGHLDYREGWRL